MLKELVLRMNDVVDVTEEQQKMIIKLVEMKDGENKDFAMSKVTQDTDWELLRRS